MINNKIIKFNNKSLWDKYLKKTNSIMLESSYNFCNISKLFNNMNTNILFLNNGSKCTYTYLK